MTPKTVEKIKNTFFGFSKLPHQKHTQKDAKKHCFVKIRIKQILCRPAILLLSVLQRVSPMVMWEAAW